LKHSSASARYSETVLINGSFRVTTIKLKSSIGSVAGFYALLPTAFRLARPGIRHSSVRDPTIDFLLISRRVLFIWCRLGFAQCSQFATAQSPNQCAH
jgi:hypothetical protein